MNIFLEAFLFIDVFIIGIAAEIAYRHAKAHYGIKREAKPQTSHLPEPENLSHEMRQRLIAETEEKYRQVLDHSALLLNKEMMNTAEKINNSVKKLADDVASKEKSGFEELLEKYEKSASDSLTDVKRQNEQYQAELRAKVEAEVEAEKQRLIDLIDQKLADLIISFLTESMQHEIDLGSQSEYLLKQLDLHKEEFKQAVHEEV